MSDPVNRRRFLGAAALSGAAVATLGSRAALAQESTPSAEATPAEAPDDSSRITVNQLGPTATPLGEAVPPEITDPANWSQENVDLSNTRNYLGSSISASNASQLGTSWSHPRLLLPAPGAH
ncbi:MAG TPA: hypothetical protein VNZ58_14045 [Thermomicrobiales bacterium]|nr:hypothetical protein [Thermomicrobiales bacterium]